MQLRHLGAAAIAGALALAVTVADAKEDVALINAKLKRWVRPTGTCSFGETERLATYYMHGRRTANGERFNPHGLTAAHRSLPFGTVLRVRNPKSGKTVRVRINDRGPFTIAWLDLAYGAALAIDMRTSIFVCVSED